MDSPSAMELFRQLRLAQEKYAYFLLAAAGAAIAFAVTQTQTATISPVMVPLGAAVFCWGLSFYFGCRHLEHVHSTISANFKYFEVELGYDASVVQGEHHLQSRRGEVLERMDKNAKRAGWYGRQQFLTLILGAIFYLAWHITEMCLRS